MPDDPTAAHASTQMSNALTGYFKCEHIRVMVARLSNKDHLPPHDSELAQCQSEMHELSGWYSGLVVDTRWSVHGVLDSHAYQLYKSVEADLDAPATDSRQFLQRLEIYQSVFRNVLRTYAAYSKHQFFYLSNQQAIPRKSFIDVYYPYMAQPVRVSLDPEDKQDALNLLKPVTFPDYSGRYEYLSSASAKGVVNASYLVGPVIIPTFVEPRLSISELLVASFMFRNSLQHLSRAV